MRPSASSSIALLDTLRTPGHRRMLLTRRILAALLVGAALFLAAGSLRDNPEVYVFSRPVAAGHVLGPGDVTVARLPESAIPPAALRPDGSAPPEKRVVVAAADSGETVTEARLLGPELTGSLLHEAEKGPPAMVPLKLADPDLVPFLHHGDTVDIVTASAEADYDGGADPDSDRSSVPGRVVASRARVVSTATADDALGGGAPATILIALPEQAAHAVAAASLNLPLTVAITGERSGAESDRSA